MKQKNKLRLAWFGLDIKETERYLSKCDALYDSEAEQLETLIQSEKALNKKLRQELEQRAALPSPNKRSHPDGFADLLLRRLDDSVEALRQQGEAELQSLLALMEAKRKEQSGRRADADKQLVEYQATFDQLLEEAARLLANLKDRPKPGKQEASEKEILTIPAEIIEPVELAEEERAESLEEAKLEQTGQDVSEIAQGANVVQFRMKSILDSMPSAESEQTKVTADGTAAPAILRELPAKSEPAPKQAENAMQTKNEAASPPLPNKKASSSDFWGDVSDYMTDGYEASENAAAALPLEEIQVVAAVPEKMKAAAQHELAAAEAATAAAETPPARAASSNTSNTGSAASVASAESEASPALADEIKSIQYRYIAGKAAGENLYSEDGALIIAKGEIITADTINRVERAGKMPDLIVQMVIPGFSEQS